MPNKPKNTKPLPPTAHPKVSYKSQKEIQDLLTHIFKEAKLEVAQLKLKKGMTWKQRMEVARQADFMFGGLADKYTAKRMSTMVDWGMVSPTLIDNAALLGYARLAKFLRQNYG